MAHPGRTHLRLKLFLRFVHTSIYMELIGFRLESESPNSCEYDHVIPVVSNRVLANIKQTRSQWEAFTILFWCELTFRIRLHDTAPAPSMATAILPWYKMGFTSCYESIYTARRQCRPLRPMASDGVVGHWIQYQLPTVPIALLGAVGRRERRRRRCCVV